MDSADCTDNTSPKIPFVLFDWDARVCPFTQDALVAVLQHDVIPLVRGELVAYAGIGTARDRPGKSVVAIVLALPDETTELRALVPLFAATLRSRRYISNIRIGT